MPVGTFNYTTGPATLQGVGTLSYNGCVFSPLFISKLSGVAVKDNAKRTTKQMDVTLEVDGYVTLAAGSATTASTMATLFQLLTAQGGNLIYTGRGFDLKVNTAGVVNFNGAQSDVAWGPSPEILEFQPLGAGRSAKIVWRVVVRVVPRSPAQGQGQGLGVVSINTFAPGNINRINNNLAAPLLQFNVGTVLDYGEDGYSTISIKGTMEIPLTRPTQGQMAGFTTTVDTYRDQLDLRIFSGIDLNLFSISRREYNISRDKRTMEFDVEVTEKPYMDLPAGCMDARGRYSFKPAKIGMGLCDWRCTLSATYTVRGPIRSPLNGEGPVARQVAYMAFLALLRLKMDRSRLGSTINDLGAPVGGLDSGAAPDISNPTAFAPIIPSNPNPAAYWAQLIATQPPEINSLNRKAWLIDFSGEEGLYRDSKTSTFSATWRLITTFRYIMQASGLWAKLPEKGAGGDNLWATSVSNVVGSSSWLPNELDPSTDVIVDFGGP